MDLEGIVPSEISQKDKICALSHLYVESLGSEENAEMVKEYKVAVTRCISSEL